MQLNRPIILNVAGLDSSAGAGLLADIKTFEQHGVYGLGITTAQTVQTENMFFSIRWEAEQDIQSLRRIVNCIHATDKKLKIINEKEPGVDYLFTINETVKLEPCGESVYPKHGSGCVLSSSIAANLALSYDVVAACSHAKIYTERFLSSNHTLLGYHVF